MALRFAVTAAVLEPLALQLAVLEPLALQMEPWALQMEARALAPQKVSLQMAVLGPPALQLVALGPPALQLVALGPPALQVALAPRVGGALIHLVVSQAMVLAPKAPR